MVATRTSFSAGKELALLLEPSPDAFLVERWQASTEEARRLPALKPGLSLGGAHDIRPVLQRAHLGGVLQPLELLDVASTARVSRIWRSTVVRLRESLPMLANVAARLADLQGVEDAINHAIEPGGEVRDDASPKLHQVRRDLRIARDRLMSQLNSLLHSMRTSLQDSVITQRNGRYVLPVKSDERGKVKGIVHDQSASGQTLFIEPLPIVEAGNRIRGLEAEERHEVERILRELSNRVALHRDELDGSVEALAELDLHLAKGRLGDEMDAVRPILHQLPRRSQTQPIVTPLRGPSPTLEGQRRPADRRAWRDVRRAGDHRPEHRRQDRGAQDGRAAQLDGPGRARRSRPARAPSLLSSSGSSRTSATSRASSRASRRSPRTSPTSSGCWSRPTTPR